MNPFDLRGPEFLVFYLVLAIITCLALYWHRRSLESGPLPPLELKDPYLFAFLQGGVSEVIRAGTISLIDRRILANDRGFLHAVPERGSDSPIEAEILEFFRKPKAFRDLVKATEPFKELCRGYEGELISKRLVPDVPLNRERRQWLATAIVVLAGTAALKIMIALSRGRTNVIFLIILSIVAVVVATCTGASRRTILGDKYLTSVRQLFAGVRSKRNSIQPGGATQDLLWLTALFGVAAIPQSVFPFVSDLMPKSGGGGDGSGGCSGGCGGGGCGGGCGGCGG